MNAAGPPPASFLNEHQALACIHCGLCLSSCPTYLETGNENDSPRGRIYLMRAVQAGRLPLAQTTVRHIDLCLGCRACEAACPSGVPYGELLEATRDHIESHYRRPIMQRWLRRVAIERVFPFPGRMRWVLWLARLAKRTGLERLLPRFARTALELVPSNVIWANWPEYSARKGANRNRVGFLQGCVQSVLFGRTNASTIWLLGEAGCDVATPRDQVCCGALYAHSGRLDQARACARHNIEKFEGLGLEAIIVNAAGCGSTLKEYGQLLEGDPAWAERARQFSAKVKDLSEWLTRPEHILGDLLARSDARVTYHDACHLAHAQRITREPRELVRAVAGKNFVELPESEICCGSAGSYNLTEPEMAARLQNRKIENILKTGAQIVVTTNPGCILQIQAGLRKAGAARIQVVHLSDYLAEARSQVMHRRRDL